MITFRTKQGFFVTRNISKQSFNVIEHFTLADIDSKYLNIYIKINAKMTQINCFLFNNLLQSFKSQNNGFIKTFGM